MELDKVRKELDIYDNAIKTLVTLRMSLIPIVTDIKVKNKLPLFQSKRENEMYANISKFAKENGVSEELVTQIYKQIIANALEIEHSLSENSTESVLSRNIDEELLEKLRDKFYKLDDILENEIPSLIEQIKDISLDSKNLTDKATLYYNNKLNK